jgi:hypothetical protein
MVVVRRGGWGGMVGQMPDDRGDASVVLVVLVLLLLQRPRMHVRVGVRQAEACSGHGPYRLQAIATPTAAHLLEGTTTLFDAHLYCSSRAAQPAPTALLHGRATCSTTFILTPHLRIRPYMINGIQTARQTRAARPKMPKLPTHRHRSHATFMVEGPVHGPRHRIEASCASWCCAC